MRLRLSVVLIVMIVVTFLTSIMVSGKNAKEWNKEGLSLLEKGKYEEALNCFNKALELDPGVPQLLNNKGYALYNMGKSGNNTYYVERSLEVYNQAISKKGDYDKAYYNKGLSLMYLKKYGEAKKCFNRVLEINPSDSDAKDRIKECDSAMNSQPTPTPVAVDNSKVSELMKKANGCYEKGEYDNAVTLYEAVLVIDPNNKEAIGKKAAAEVLAKQAAVTPTPVSVSVSGGKSYTETGSGVNFDMVYIDGGTFQMGSNNGGDESPVHSVTVSSFYMGKYEVTNREYSMYDSGHQGNWSDRSYPIERVSWDDAVGYCRWLSGRTGKTYRLPTEAEWEYACRAGSSTAYYWGDSMNDSYCWYGNNSGGQVHPVGQKSPNAWGLFDMSGNVWEWCSDCYSNSYYSQSPLSNPAGPGSGSYRVIRGGCWDSGPDYCRSARRFGNTPDNRNNNLGFRLLSTCYLPEE